MNVSGMNVSGMNVSGRLLDVRHVWKSYTPDVFAVRDVNFTLEPGAFLTLLGPSGSGKTSTLMMVAGFEAPTEGEIRVGGRDVAGLPAEKRNFGVVFQGYALFPHMSVLDNVEFALRMRKVGRGDRRRQAMAMLDRVGLAAFAHRRPRELSGGQQQRVALARALVFEPDALLLDEPLGALDRKLREQLQAEIKDIQRRVGISILFVTHDQDEAMTMSDQIAVMADGQVVQIGTPAEVYQHPNTAFVAGFLGETNLLPVVVRGVENGHAVVRFEDGTTGRARMPRGGRPPASGASGFVSIRPERLRFLGDGASSDHSTDGVVGGHVFLGRHARSTVRALGQALIVSSLDPQRSETVRIGWDTDDAQLLAPEGPD
ncbi:MAG TPA: ABC transporter ATP-binding protein [Rhodopila sp.]|uniref:ABC transporter ATP-binding protein n=1 Tax=Rhodopila sp. TaxID=2480087 RepID=UPI002CBF98B9|nr:ABC transporter ATP-binding protein [Rhodopila sp.]HVY18232.1 ABC transporter ATP-binding protein [Rhodopila sp.]